MARIKEEMTSDSAIPSVEEHQESRESGHGKSGESNHQQRTDTVSPSSESVQKIFDSAASIPVCRTESGKSSSDPFFPTPPSTSTLPSSAFSSPDPLSTSSFSTSSSIQLPSNLPFSPSYSPSILLSSSPSTLPSTSTFLSSPLPSSSFSKGTPIHSISNKLKISGWLSSSPIPALEVIILSQPTTCQPPQSKTFFIDPEASSSHPQQMDTSLPSFPASNGSSVVTKPFTVKAGPAGLGSFELNFLDHYTKFVS